MTAPEFRAIRDKLGLTQRALAFALGYSGPNSAIEISKFENNFQPIPKKVARLMLMFERFGVPEDFTRP